MGDLMVNEEQEWTGLNNSPSPENGQQDVGLLGLAGRKAASEKSHLGFNEGLMNGTQSRAVISQSSG